MSKNATAPDGILVVRLGAMGDILHALPAVSALKRSFPGTPLTWVVESNWAPLLEGNRSVDRVVLFERRRPSTWARTRRELRRHRYSLAIDFQGLMKSALIARLASPDRIMGFDASQVRERAAAWLYSDPLVSAARHVVERNLDLTHAAGAGTLPPIFELPSGKPEGGLPESGFVLASPFAGWTSKQWPLEYYAEFAARLESAYGLPLVLNGPPSARDELAAVPNTLIHVSGLAGLIDATRRAAAVVGVDSGPMHLAAALGKPGVALFGPTDPERNGPYGGSLEVLRSARAITTYRRGTEIDPSMRDVTPEQVMAALKSRIGCRV